MNFDNIDWSLSNRAIARLLGCSHKYVRKVRFQKGLPPLWISPRCGRQNKDIWSRVNFNNTDAAIARRLGCDPRSVREQRQKRGIKPFAGRGGNRFAHPPYREGPNPLPAVIRPL